MCTTVALTTPHSQASHILNVLYTNNPSLSLSSLNMWIKATEGPTRAEAVRGVPKEVQN